jgi:hypothetical protein
LNQWLEISLPGEPVVTTIHFEETSCGLKLEALEVMKCLEEQRLESSIMSHDVSRLLLQNLDMIRLRAGINY